jgi:hypothetical protein
VSGEPAGEGIGGGGAVPPIGESFEDIVGGQRGSEADAEEGGEGCGIDEGLAGEVDGVGGDGDAGGIELAAHGALGEEPVIEALEGEPFAVAGDVPGEGEKECVESAGHGKGDPFGGAEEGVVGEMEAMGEGDDAEAGDSDAVGGEGGDFGGKFGEEGIDGGVGEGGGVATGEEEVEAEGIGGDGEEGLAIGGLGKGEGEIGGVAGGGRGVAGEGEIGIGEEAAGVGEDGEGAGAEVFIALGAGETGAPGHDGEALAGEGAGGGGGDAEAGLDGGSAGDVERFHNFYCGGFRPDSRRRVAAKSRTGTGGALASSRAADWRRSREAAMGARRSKGKRPSS